MQWSRENDALIARVAERLDVESRACFSLPDPDYFSVKTGRIHRYNTDIAACIRAAEAWASNGAEYYPRHWILERPGPPLILAKLEEWSTDGHWKVFRGWSELNSPAEAMAWALWTACQ